MESRGWLLVGTAAGVGTTVVAAALCTLRSQLGHEVVHVKPVQPGAADGHDDGADVAASTGVATVTGAMVAASLPPGVAARRGGAELTAADLVAVIRQVGTDHPGAELVVEGAGGLLDQLGSDGTTAADLAAATQLPLLVVTPPDPRSLNAVALTVEVAVRRGLAVAGVVVTTDPDRSGHAHTHAPHAHAQRDRAERAHVQRDGAGVAAPEELAEVDRVSGCLVGALPVLDLGSPAAFAAAGDHLGPALGGRWSPPPRA